MPDPAPHDAHLPPGAAAWPERYTRGAEIARGGMGVIERVTDRQLGRDVAMKVVVGAHEPERLQRFLDEARITGQLEHPNIVPVHEMGTDAEGRTYFTMKLVAGESLETVLQRLADGDAGARAQYPRARLLQVLLRVCDAIGLAHSRGVIHRDVKPENVMVGSFGEVLVMDWGLAKARGRAEASGPGAGAPVLGGASEGRTLDGSLLGTPAYMAPEQARGDHARVDARSDVFALGAMLYAILTHQPPYDGTSLYAVVDQAQRRALVPPRARAPQNAVPAELESICLRAMAADPVDRYEDVADLASDLQAYCDGRAVHAHHYGPGARLVRWAQRHAVATVSLAVAGVVLAAAGGVLGVVLSQKSAAEAREAAAEVRRERAEAQRRQAEADAEVQRLRTRESELLAAAARQQAAEAKSSLAKSRLVTGLLRSARAELGGVALGLKRVSASAMSDDAKVEAARRLWDEVERYAATVPADATSQATWLAVRGWLHFCMGDGRRAGEAFAAARERDPEVVHGWLFEALVHFVVYMRAERFAAYNITPKGIEWHHPPGESAEQMASREQYETLLARLSETQVWGETSAADFRRALQGFQDWYGGRLEAAVDGFSRALTVPEMDWIADELFFMRAKARLRTLDFVGALADLHRAISYDSLGSSPLLYRAQALQMHGFAERFAGRDPVRSWEEAVRWYEDTERRFPRQQVIDQPLGLTRMSLAQWLQEHGGNGRPLLEQAIADFTRGTTPAGHQALDYNAAVAFASRHNARTLLASWQDHDGGDSRATRRAALQDVLDALATFNNLRYRDESLARAVRAYGEALSRRGERPAPVLRAWLDELAARVSAEPHTLRWIGHREELLHALARYPEELPLRRRHATFPGTQSHGLQLRIQELGPLVALPPWQALVRRAEVWTELGDYVAARELYEAALAQAPAEPAGDDAAAVAQAWYRCARLRSAASVGKQTLALPQAPDADTAAALRGAALTALERAVALGLPDRGALAGDSALAPLHGDPRFNALVGG